jgi:hypothetical protein
VPADTICDATVACVNNACVGRVQNGAGAGPFDEIMAFTQSVAARKGAIAHRLKKCMEIGGRR